MTVCQILILVLIVARHIAMIYSDCNGQQAVPAKGFSGVITTMLSLMFWLVALYYAGCMSTMFQTRE